MGHGAIERKREEGKSGETNDLAWRDSSQSIIFKQKQCCPREHLRSAYLIKSPSLHIYGLQILTFWAGTALSSERGFVEGIFNGLFPIDVDVLSASVKNSV